jgi:hypothetical protein
VNGFGRENADSSGRTPALVWADWVAANEAGDAERAGHLAEEMTRVAPESFYSWFEAGLHAKARHDWVRCLEWNRRAATLFGPGEQQDFGGVNPAVWNLGIAATALGDWVAARGAWIQFGVGGVDDGAEPIDMNLGQVPIRLNPDRPSLSLQVVPDHGATEVVWCWRRSPAHAVIASVPLPESGHRYRDVLLHDGEPRGTRTVGDAEVSVFDELERLRDSALPTWQAQVAGATPDDVGSLADLIGDRGLGVDDWSGMDILCSDCSHGSPGAHHSHQPAPAGTTTLGLAGPESDLSECLAAWGQARPGVSIDSVDLLW